MRKIRNQKISQFYKPHAVGIWNFAEEHKWNLLKFFVKIRNRDFEEIIVWLWT